MNSIDRQTLASFFEDWLFGRDVRHQWDGLIVTHYRDDVMENARIEFVRITLRYNTVQSLTDLDRERVLSLVYKLRNTEK
ncbi:hypothetical protein AEYBE204_06585 [Asticcacaulis sp. YBE204]|nr:hypothetical protein AEYBE204_06585 [Asticcacaulis sp. YBE204]